MKPLVFVAALAGMLVLGSALRAAEENVTELIQALGSTDADSRIDAARKLEALGPAAAPAVPALIGLLDSKDAELQAHAVAALGGIGSAASPAAKKLASLIRDDDPKVRREAVESLQEIRPGPQVMLPILAELLKDSDPVLRSRIMAALAEMGAQSMRLLVPALANEDTAYFACMVICEIGPDAKEAVPQLVKLLASENPGLQREAIMALGAIGPDARPAVAPLSALIDSPVNAVPAIYALGNIGNVPAEVNSKLAEKADGDDPILKTVSAWALARLHPADERFARRAVKLLVDSLRSEDPAVRVAAAEALQTLNADPAIVRPIMLEALEKADEETTIAMLDAMVALGPEIVPQLVAALKHQKARHYVCYVLGELGPGAAPATEALAGLVGDADETTQNEAAFALAEIGPDASAAVPALQKALESEGPVRFAAAYALGRIGPKAIAAKPALLDRLDGDANMALISAWALAHIHPECPTCQQKAMPLLTAGLDDPDPKFRREAANGIACFGKTAEGAAKKLRKTLKDPDEKVREAAAEALKAIGK
ncbi:MAG: HEAT repeat domain-containing protein [Thermoguttaceae bacterium]